MYLFYSSLNANNSCVSEIQNLWREETQGSSSKGITARTIVSLKCRRINLTLSLLQQN
jgi:hypothetical protein